MIPKELSINSIEQVYKNIKPFINVTPLIKANKIIDETFKTNIFLKFECFQKSGSFKARGATNNILSSDKKDHIKQWTRLEVIKDYKFYIVSLNMLAGPWIITGIFIYQSFIKP